VDAELLRYGPEIQAAEAMAIFAERHAKIQSAAARLVFRVRNLKKP
jgi:hypothetical protein